MKQYEVTVKFPYDYNGKILEEIKRAAHLLSKKVELIQTGKPPKRIMNEKMFTISVDLKNIVDVAVAYSIAKPFLDSFLKELGSKSANALAKVFAGLTSRIKTEILKSGNLRHFERLTMGSKQPKSPLAIQVYILDNLPVTFIFPNAVAPKRMTSVLKKIPIIIENHISLIQRGNLSRHIENYIEYKGRIEYTLHGYNWIMPATQRLIYFEFFKKKAMIVSLSSKELVPLKEMERLIKS